MSVSTVETIIARISTAPINSPIAVFLTPHSKRTSQFDAVFANTIVSRKRLKMADPALVGVFTSGNSAAQIRAVLQKAML